MGHVHGSRPGLHQQRGLDKKNRKRNTNRKTPILSKKRRMDLVVDPWERNIILDSRTPDEVIYATEYGLERPKFHERCGNEFLDIKTKKAALRACPSVVSLVSYSGEEEIFQCSGTIIESNESSSIILTSADLIRVRSPIDEKNGSCIADDDEICDSCIADPIKVVVHLSNRQAFDGQILNFDFHYNLVAIKIQSSAPAAHLRLIDDSITVDPSQFIEKAHFKLLPHSQFYNLTPGDSVIVLGRYCKKPYDILAAPGEFSIENIDQCEHECKELCRANCRITRCGVGGPLVNCYGEVIGICFYDIFFTPFLPINLASKWWYHCKRNREIRRPLLSMELTNLYAARLSILEDVIQKFPNTFKGVVVEEVAQGSSAELAGICPNDIIVEFGGKKIKSFLGLLEMMWDFVGNPEELRVLRIGESVSLPISMTIDEVPEDNFYRWPLLEHVK